MSTDKITNCDCTRMKTDKVDGLARILLESINSPRLTRLALLVALGVVWPAAPSKEGPAAGVSASLGSVLMMSPAGPPGDSTWGRPRPPIAVVTNPTTYEPRIHPGLGDPGLGGPRMGDPRLGGPVICEEAGLRWERSYDAPRLAPGPVE